MRVMSIIEGDFERQVLADCVEKLRRYCARFLARKIDLSDRSRIDDRDVVKGSSTPGNALEMS
jgi:hypothetical protein